MMKIKNIPPFYLFIELSIIVILVLINLCFTQTALAELLDTKIVKVESTIKDEITVKSEGVSIVRNKFTNPVAILNDDEIKTDRNSKATLEFYFNSKNNSKSIIKVFTNSHIKIFSDSNEIWLIEGAFLNKINSKYYDIKKIYKFKAGDDIEGIVEGTEFFAELMDKEALIGTLSGKVRARSLTNKWAEQTLFQGKKLIISKNKAIVSDFSKDEIDLIKEGNRVPFNAGKTSLQNDSCDQLQIASFLNDEHPFAFLSDSSIGTVLRNNQTIKFDTQFKFSPGDIVKVNDRFSVLWRSNNTVEIFVFPNTEFKVGEFCESFYLHSGEILFSGFNSKFLETENVKFVNDSIDKIFNLAVNKDNENNLVNEAIQVMRGTVKFASKSNSWIEQTGTAMNSYTLKINENPSSIELKPNEFNSIIHSANLMKKAAIDSYFYVPMIVGLNMTDAIKALKKEKFNFDPSFLGQKDLINDQDPAAGALATEGSTVTVMPLSMPAPEIKDITIQ